MNTKIETSTANPEIETTTEVKPSWQKRIKQLGWGAFLFFLIKGLVWLAIFFGLGKWLKDLF